MTSASTSPAGDDRSTGHRRFGVIRPREIRKFLWLVMLVFRPALALDPFDQWTVDHGLPQNSVQAVIRAQDGYLWLATFDGLARFDGLRFKIFDKSNTPGFQANSILSLHEDHQGALWLGLANGMVSRHYKGVFTSYGRDHGLPGSPVYGICSSTDKDLWVLCGDQPMQVNGQWQPGVRPVRWRHDRFDPSPLPELQRSFHDFWWNARESTIWFRDPTGLHHFTNGRFFVLTPEDGLPDCRIRAAHHDQFGNVWILTDAAGLLQMRDGRVVRTLTVADGLPSNWQTDPDNPRQFLVTEDGQGALWMSGMGIWLGRLKDGVFTEFPLPNPSGARVNAFHRDLEGHLWIATDSVGLLRVREQVIKVHSTPEGLPAGNIYPVCATRDGAVWVGAWSQGLARLKDGKVTSYTVNDGLPYPKVTSLYEDREGRLWVGTFGGLRYLREGQFHPGPAPLARPGHVISAILQDRRGAFWFGSDLGLWNFSSDTNRLYTVEDGLAANDIKAIIEGSDGALWVAAYGGLTRLRDGVITAWTEEDGLPSNSIRSLCADRDGAIWVGTHDGGLGRFQAGRFDRFTVRDGMFNNGVFQILEDSQGYFWMSCNKGIHRVNHAELVAFAQGSRRSMNSVAYGRSDGLRNVECNGGRWPAGAKTPDGRLWFPTQDGVAEVDPEAVRRDLRPPTVVIESCLLDRVAVPVGDLVIVPPGTETFEIQYTGLSFVNAERVQFKYRLSGIERQWVDAGTRRAAYYSHVPPGAYRFSVIAANRDGIWNETGAQLMVRVDPTWWQTTLFRALVVLIAAGAVLGFFEVRVQRLERLRTQQEAFSRRILESQEAERKRIAVELHDGLGQNLLIAVNRAGLGARNCADAAQAQERLGEIEGLLHDAIQEVRTISQNLRPAYLERIGLTKSLQAAVAKAAAATSIRFVSHIEPIDDCFSRDNRIHVYRLLQEALNNVMKHSQAHQAEIEVRRGQEAVTLVVSDDGRGFDPSAVPSPARTTPGLGLIGMVERVHLLGGTWACRSEPGAGTTLRMRLPVQPGTARDPDSA